MNKKTQKMTLLMTVFILLTSICCINSTMAVPVHSIKGVLYINGAIAPENISIYLEFPTGTENTTTYVFDTYGDLTNYNIGFWGHNGETGNFTVEINGKEIIPEDNQTILIEYGVTGYIMDLHIIVETPENHPPEKPVNPDPENNSENVSINPIISVNVSDPDDDAMIISFFDASDDSLIGTVTDVANGSIASVTWSDLEYNTAYSWYAVANDSEFENKSETWSFTTEEETENNPPDKPTNPQPEDNSEDISFNPTLSVDVSDPDDDTMNVSFYNASDDSLIDIATNVANGNTATITWADLSYNTIYSWYAVANDSEFENISEIWSFTTEEEAENMPPTVEITKPENALYLFNIKIRNHRLRFRKPLIFGRITIEANASDEDSGIERVEFYINGNLMGNDTNAAYTYNWTRDHIRLIHRFTIKVVAYDNEGATAEDSMVVRKFL